MPNHVHGIVVIKQGSDAVGARHASPLHHRAHGFAPGSLAAVVASYKSAVSKAVNVYRNTPRHRVWQRNYYEHVIRDYPDLEQIRHYIFNNLLTWETDSENP